MWVYVSIASVTVITLAWFFVVMVSARLRQTPAQTVLDIEEAAEFIKNHSIKKITVFLKNPGLYRQFQLIFHGKRITEDGLIF